MAERRPHKPKMVVRIYLPQHKMVSAQTLDKMYKKKCQTWLRPKVDTAIYVIKLGLLRQLITVSGAQNSGRLDKLSPNSLN